MYNVLYRLCDVQDDMLHSVTRVHIQGATKLHAKGETEQVIDHNLKVVLTNHVHPFTNARFWNRGLESNDNLITINFGLGVKLIAIDLLGHGHFTYTSRL